MKMMVNMSKLIHLEDLMVFDYQVILSSEKNVHLRNLHFENCWFGIEEWREIERFKKLVKLCVIAATGSVDLTNDILGEIVDGMIDLQKLEVKKCKNFNSLCVRANGGRITGELIRKM